MSLTTSVSPWGKTSIETRYGQEEKKAADAGKENRLGKVITPILSWQVDGDDGVRHTLRLVGCEYAALLEIDGDCYLPVDGSSVARFL